ncbi:MAG: hypothetical protein AB1646_15930 [Thermodesulfobacteriota bacterium]
MSRPLDTARGTYSMVEPRYGEVALSVEDRLIFAWWNTGLSPLGKNRATESDFREAARITASLLVDHHVDCLALGEVRGDDLDRLIDQPKTASFALYDGTGSDGKLVFDVGVIHRPDRLTLESSTKLTERHGKVSLKLANRLEFQIETGSPPLYLLISHWPSPVYRDNRDDPWTKLAHALYGEVEELMSCYGSDARIILMGDFNREPFDSCMEVDLLATRDRTLVRKKSEYLYNPFWRHLGESIPYDPASSERSFAGTCYLKRGNCTRWKTVDQVIVSSGFLGGSQWHLNEDATKYLPMTPLARDGLSRAGIFDHFPVIAVIEKVGKDGG